MNHLLNKKNNHVLILKHAMFSILDREDCLKKINKIKIMFQRLELTKCLFITWFIIIRGDE